ncbi:MAG: AMP-binding protein, partial [Acidobacteriota bacterium]
MLEDDLHLQEWLSYVDEVVRQPGPPPFSEQWQRFELISAKRPEAQGPLPAWIPDTAAIASSNIGRLAAERGIPLFEELHRWSVSRKRQFWSMVIERLNIPFATPPSEILACDDPTLPGWLSGATLDITAACFTAEPEKQAIVSAREGWTGLRTMSSAQLQALVDRVANGIKALGLEPNAGVALYMPMTPECVAAYLGVIRAGHPVVSIADSFAADEVARVAAVGQDASSAVADYNALLQQQASTTVQASEQTVALAGTIQELQALQQSRGYLAEDDLRAVLALETGSWIRDGRAELLLAGLKPTRTLVRVSAGVLREAEELAGEVGW